MPKTRLTKPAKKRRASLLRALKGVRLFATDVDGVLTDGGMYYSESGDELKKFNTRDGMGIKLLQRGGLITALITMEETKLVMRRAEKLAIPEVHQGARDKLAILRALATRHGLTLEEMAYIGDDVNDVEALKAVGFSAAPADAMRCQLGEWKDELSHNFVIEPEARNTAPAIALAAIELIKRDPEAVMLVLPADHVIKGDKKFQAAVALGAELATKGYLITFGVKPVRPETGYGYIQPNRRARLASRGGLVGYPVARFVEKPDAKKAARYLQAGNYYWNSGIFVWRASTILDELARHQPALARGMKKIGELKKSEEGSSEMAQLYQRLTPVSIDHGVM